MRSLLAALAVLVAAPLAAQPAGDCPYPVLFLHGYTGSQVSWEPFTGEPDVAAIWGPRADVFHAVLNAYENEERIAGPDGIRGTADDDVLVQFVNEDNALAPGCVYASNWENFWNEDSGAPLLEVNSGDSPGGIFASESDSNEEAAQKQGYALGRMIEAVLAANPDKDRVILVGHSMGGLIAREYLQRRDASGTPMWWVEPGATGGHRVARLLTVGTPHRGSNLFGNPFRPSPDAPASAQRDGTPDINSAAVRDLRYSYFCLFCDGPGPYLWGGDEDGIASGFHTDDVDLDGDETSTITGINVDGRHQGFSDAEDGTTDNPAMPLPTDVRYTWLTSDVGTSGDLVVDLARQWIYAGSVPVPTDGVPYRLADTLLTDTFHLDQQEDTDAVARGLDEPDYPAHAYGIATETTYAGTATIRSAGAPDGPPTSDPDWYAVESTGGALRVDLTPAAGLGGRLDLYDAPPGDYSTAPSALGVDFAPGSASVTIPASAASAGTHYVRVRHDGIGPADWRRPYTLTVTEEEAPITLRVAVQLKGEPVVLGPGGGTFRVIHKLTNPTPEPQTADFWGRIIAPDGSVVEAVSPMEVTVAGGAKPRLRFTLRVPASGPAGTYVYRAFVGTYPVAVQSKSVTFEKTATGPLTEIVDAWGAELVTEEEPDEPGAVVLAEPSPNPFASRTTLAFTLDDEAVVSLAVFDALGRRVAVLAEGVRQPGTHRAVFDASALAPGAYVVRLEAAGEVVTRRAVRVQ